MNNVSKTRPSVLEVWLNQTRVGTLTNLPYDRNLFVFDEDYVADRNRPVLSLNFYDVNGNLVTEPQEVQTKVPPFFSNVLPEGRLREYLAARGGVKEVREFFLLWLLGADLPGAVLIQDSEGRPLPPAGDNKDEGQARPIPEKVLRFSLAGLQLKFSAVGSPGKQLAVPAEGRGGYWIIKLPSPSYSHVPENEFSMMKLAADVGIEVAEVGLVPTNQVEGLPEEFSKMTANSLYVRRFDRTAEGARIHIEDFNQLYGQFSGAKYDNYSYTNMAGDIWRVLGEQAVVEFVRRLIFSAAIGNADMHLKNWSLFYPDGRSPQLSAGYDFVSTIQYINDRKMALSIAKEKDTGKLDQQLLERFAAKARVPTALVVETAWETAERVVQAWSRLKGDLPIDQEGRERIDEQLKYVPLTRRFLAGTSAETTRTPESRPATSFSEHPAGSVS